MRKGVLVTGGAGYIGSHVVKQLGRQGRHIVTIDDLSRGFPEAVVHGRLVVGDFADTALLAQLISEHEVGAVMHFAASTVVPESISRPLFYYRNNTLKTHALIECCLEAGIEHFIFSSTAAVYGVPERDFVCERSPTRPINPYGASKMMAERILSDVSNATALRHVIIRYFNVAGSDPEGQIGQSTPKATLLMKIACEVAIGRRDEVQVFGTDYPTPDGTGIRDYIHVEDLADAHLRALAYLERGGKSATINCGYGHGYSVRDVLNAVERVSGTRLPVREANRRAGDPPALVASADRIRELLDWKPRYDDLESIVKTSLNWEKNPRY